MDFVLPILRHLSLLTLLVPLLTSVAVAQAAPNETDPEDDSSISSPPVAVVNIAGVDRVVEDIHYLFESVDRADMKDVVDGLLGNLGNLDGLDRGRPFGVMLFLKPGLVPQPVPVAYLPVSDIASLTRTMELGPVTTKRLTDDRYEISGPRRTFYARLVGEYAFVSTDEEILDREFSPPAETFAALTTRYDIAVDVRPENLPPGMRELFVATIRSKTQAELQQRDDESDAGYALRKSHGMNNLRIIEAFLKETRSLTLGLDTSPANRKAVLELVVEAIPGTPYLESLQGLAEKPSRFTPVLDDDASQSFSVNSKLDDAGKLVQKDLLSFGELQAARLLTRLEQSGGLEQTIDGVPASDAGDDIDPVSEALARKIFEPLKAAVDSGNLDAFAQFRGDPEKKFVVVAGVEVPGASGMETAVREFLDRFRAASPSAASDMDVQYGVADAAGVPLHRISSREIREQERRMYGEQFGLYVGFDSNVIWAAVGGPQAAVELGEIVTRVKEAGPQERVQADAPFKLLVTANRWIGLDPDDRNADLAKDAFDDGADTLRIDFRPTEKGGRLRIEAEEGFIRLLGLGISRRYDESQL